MKAFTVILALAGAVAAQPTIVARESVCTDLLYSVAQCCSTDVLGVADLDCETPSSASNRDDFTSACSSSGKQAKCCTIPLAGLGVLCNDV